MKEFGLSMIAVSIMFLSGCAMTEKMEMDSGAEMKNEMKMDSMDNGMDSEKMEMDGTY